jgi:hypothetical protein
VLRERAKVKSWTKYKFLKLTVLAILLLILFFQLFLRYHGKVGEVATSPRKRTVKIDFVFPNKDGVIGVTEDKPANNVRVADAVSQETAGKASISHYYEDSEGYELLSAVLDKEAKTLKLDRFEVYGRTVVASVRISLCRELPEEFRSAADDFVNKSKIELQFKREFSLGHPYKLTRAYGATDFGISAVGFDASRTHAVVTVVRGCGLNCSGGSTYLFRKTEKGWQEVGQICEVMS